MDLNIILNGMIHFSNITGKIAVTIYLEMYNIKFGIVELNAEV